jgi:ACR3 family arsenite efflux pump ArsB
MTETQATPLRKGDRWEPVLLLTAVGLGLGLARAAPELAGRAEPMISPALVLVLFAIFYRVPIERLRTAFGHRPYLGAALGLNFLLTPLVAYGLGWLFLRDVPALWVGLVLVLVTPCTDWYLVFTALARGDVALNLALLPWNLVLQLVLLPVYLSLLTQSLLPVDPGLVLRSVVVYVLVPFASAQLMRVFFHKGMENWMVWVQYIGFTALLVAMFAHQGRVLFERPLVMLQLVPPVSLFLVLLALAAVGLGRWLDFSAPTRAALASTACARNSPLTLSLALLLFPGTPLVALTQVVEPLIELPLLILLASWLRRSR